MRENRACRRSHSPATEGTCRVKATATRPKIMVTGGGRGVVGHAGARLLTDLADATGLTSAFGEALAGLRQRQGGHDPGRIAVDLAVMLAGGGEAIADLAVLRDQPGLFGPVASDPTAWRMLSRLDQPMLAGLQSARARAREVAWAQHAEVNGDLPQPIAAGQQVDGLVLDIDATIVICHSEKEGATRTWKKTFGFHPLLCFLDNTGEALAGLLREGRAGSNTTTDHITVLDQALALVPDVCRHGSPILLRADTAGSSHGFLAHIRGLRQQQHLDIRFSVGAAITEPVREAIRAATGWIPAIDTGGDLREHAEVCEITGLFDATGWPEGTRFLIRRERPHPGAQLSLFDTIEGWRHQIVATDTPPGGGSIQFLEARHRAHARVEDRIRTGKDTGFGRFPSRLFTINQAWLQLALTAIDLLAWTQNLLLNGELATAEPKKLRYRLLHVAARITRTARRTRLAIANGWPWTDALTSAFTTLAALPRPTG
uniref:IS1380 family transposase n=1 Tax=Micromonospora polyrhachis TaxID=1282883 RepID=UPI0028AE1850|nr:IS1380 family transposase [Micromonospora polyrhachis]